MICFYLGKLFWPADLTFIYPRWHVDPADWQQYLFPAAAILLVAVAWMLRGRRRGPLAALLFFIGTLFPVLGFCNVYPFIYSFVADHFQYLASLGVIALASAGVALLLDRRRMWGRPAGHAVCFVPLAILAVLTWRQSGMYADLDALYETTLERNPECWMAHINLGNLLASRGRIDEAIVHYRQALDIKPDYAEAYKNLGDVLAKLHRFDEAIARYREALRLKPDYAETYCNLGNALLALGRIDEAVACYGEALRINPQFAERVGISNSFYPIVNSLRRRKTEPCGTHEGTPSRDAQKARQQAAADARRRHAEAPIDRPEGQLNFMRSRLHPQPHHRNVRAVQFDRPAVDRGEPSGMPDFADDQVASFVARRADRQTAGVGDEHRRAVLRVADRRCC